MGIPGSANPMLFGGAAAYEIDQSLRFNSADSAYLNRTPASAGNRRTWTWSGWVKLGRLTDCFLIAAGSSRTQLYINGSSKIQFFTGTTSTSNLETTALLRDPSAWYHIVVAVDTTQATNTNRVKFYVNGTQLTDLSTTSYPAQNLDTEINNTTTHWIGQDNSSNYASGYFAEVNFIDGTALTPSSFGETDTITGAWIPKKYSGSYGTNGFYLKFDPAATNGIGHDHSGNGNNFTATGFSTSGTGTDVMSDTPTTNYPTWNALARGDDPAVSMGVDLSDGNLVAAMNRDVGDAAWVANFAVPTSGKWYWEVEQLTAGSPNPFITTGIIAYPWTWNSSDHVKYDSRGRIGKDWNGVTYQSVSAWGAGYGSASDVCGIAVDANNNTVQFYKNGTSQGTTESYSGSTYTYVPHCTTAANTAQNVRYNFGQRAFAYTPPTGYKALNTANLPEPTIKKGSKYFNTVLYTGNGSSTRAITGAGFSPDFVWIKTRSNNDNHNLYDAVRGATKFLMSNSTAAEDTNAATLKSFDSDGFTVGDAALVNWNGWTYVAWAWDANGAGSSNTAGSITSTVSANATAGFSIVTYTSQVSTKPITLGHGLGVKPSMIICKNRDVASSWTVYHSALGATKAVFLNSTLGAVTSVDYWNNTEPTSTVFTVYDSTGTHAYGTSNKMVAYCFSEVAGYSKFGSYTGNGSTDGPFVFCGFKPAFVLVKRTDGADTWTLWDNKRPAYNEAYYSLIPNTADSEQANEACDLLSNGFKLRRTPTYYNGNGNTYIFAAFAELPAKYSNAR